MSLSSIELSSNEVVLTRNCALPEFKLVVRGKTEGLLSIKVKTNMKKMFDVIPNRLILEPKTQKSIKFVLNQFVDPKNYSQLAQLAKFQIQVLPLAERKTPQAINALFKESTSLENHILGLTFISAGQISPVKEASQEDSFSPSNSKLNSLKKQLQQLTDKQTKLQSQRQSLQSRAEEPHPSRVKALLTTVGWGLLGLLGVYGVRTLMQATQVTTSQLFI